MPPFARAKGGDPRRHTSAGDPTERGGVGGGRRGDGGSMDGFPSRRRTNVAWAVRGRVETDAQRMVNVAGMTEECTGTPE